MDLADAELWSTTWLSLKVSSSALLVATLVGAPLGVLLGAADFRGRRSLLRLARTGMALPPVLIGLLLALLLWRSGPLGALELIYTPAAMVAAQALLGIPIMTALTAAAVEQVGAPFRVQLLALGASRARLWWELLREARLPFVAALLACAGRLLSEVGAVMIVGGNLEGETRVLTTGIVLETRLGHFERALAMGGVLLALAYLIALALGAAQEGAEG